MNEQTERNEAPAEPDPRAILLASRSPIENKEDPSPLDRHSRKCQICRHPDREAIEHEYAEWRQPPVIAQQYGIPLRALYRHFEAVGLGSRRRANLRQVLERILERGAEVPINGNTIIRAVKAYCTLTDDNKWTEPAKSVTFTVQNEPKLRQTTQFDQLNRPSNDNRSLIADRDLLIDTEPIRN